MKRRFASMARGALALLFAATVAGPAGAATRPDAWVTTMVKMNLLTSDAVSAREVNVDTIDGRVTLHGSVATAAEKSAAEKVAKGVEGVREVRNLIQVVPAGQKERVAATDDQLKERVEAALKADKGLDDSEIKVKSVDQGVVLLHGKARSLTDAYRAVDVAADVPGVARVATQIESPDALADEEMWRDGEFDAASYDASTARDLWITTAAKMRLLAKEGLSGFDVNVDTENRDVTLFGIVDSAAAKQAVEAEVKQVDGVRAVKNDLQVVAPAKQDSVAKSDAQLHDAIAARLGQLGLEGDDVKVEVKAGTARLTGSVDSRSDQVAILTAARATPGVKRVIDDLELATPAVSSR
jgi:hyperosmotically inducible protein